MGVVGELNAELRALRAAADAAEARGADGGALWVTRAKPPPGAEAGAAAPWPVCVTRSVPRPPEGAPGSEYDIEELRVQLKALGPRREALPVAVKVRTALPPELHAAMEKAIRQAWCDLLVADQLERELGEAGEGPAPSWLFAACFEHVGAHFGDLMKLHPESLEVYEGVDANGGTTRRYALVEEWSGSEGEGSEEDEELDEEQEAAWLEYRKKQLEDAVELDRQRRIWAAERREAARLAEERGDSEATARKISKKEQDALLAEKKARAGSRLRKTGARKNKFAGEGSKLAKEEEKKGGKKKKEVAAA